MAYLHIWNNRHAQVDSCISFLKLTSRGVLHYLYSANLSKSFSQLAMSILIFST